MEISKQQLTILMRMAFEYWELYNKRKTSLIDDDIASSLAYSIVAWWQIKDYTKEWINTTKVIEWISTIPYEYNKFWYSKERVDKALQEPWQDVLNLIEQIQK
jgi:hypothetical protein